MGRVGHAIDRALDGAGVHSPFWRRALPPAIIAIAVVLISWAFWVPPSPLLLILLAITYALYLLPRAIRRWAAPLTALTLAVLYLLFHTQDWLFDVPVFKTMPTMDTMVIIAVYVMMALGLNMVVGYAGLLDLGYIAFFALGAYGAAWLASPHFARPDLDGVPSVDINLGAVGDVANLGVGGIHISIWAVLLTAAVITAVAGVIIGLPTLRLRGDYLAIVTLGFGEMVAQVAANGDEDGFRFNLTNGAFGINPLDPPGFGGWLEDNLGLPADFLVFGGWLTNSSTNEVFGDFVDLMYWGALALVLITLFCSIRLRDSRLGRAWIAIREDETAAAAMGIPLMRTKTWSYASGAFFGGVAGAWFASYSQGVYPSTFNFNVSVFILCMVILGGMGNVWGVMAGAAFLTYLNAEGLANMGAWFNENVLPCGGGAEAGKVISDGCIDVPVVAYGIYRTILVVVMLVRPYGLFPEARRKQEFEVGVHDEPLYDEREHGEHGAGGALMADLLLQTAALRKEFGGLVAVNDVDFTIPKGSIVALIGPNGAGKTTFFNMLTGIYRPTGGVVELLGEDVTGLPPHAITERGIGRTFQNIRLFQEMTSLENVLVGMHCRLKGGILSSIFGTPRVRREERQARERARELLEYCALSGVEEDYARNLPYGDQRRLEVARALATQPKLLLLDEPTAGMNPQESADFTAFIHKLRDEEGLTILLIEHDMKVVMGVSERLTVLDYGEKIAEGAPAEIQNDPRVIEAYLGTGAAAAV